MDLPESVLADGLLSDQERETFILFGALVEAEGKEREVLAVRIADILGNPGEFAPYLQGEEEERTIRSFHLLRVFRENVELLIQKTWVDKSEEKPKERLLEDLERFIAEYRESAIMPAFRRFVGIARSVPALLFGSIGRSPDFLEYAFRIDPKFGLFFWFVGELEEQTHSAQTDGECNGLYRLETLLGAYILSSF
ncbi:MAG: hypothetical protein ABFC75_08470 [Rectinema sp.]